MRIEVSIEIARPPDVVWPVLVDVERWHEWTASILDIKRLDHSAFGVGSKVRVRQPRLSPAVWRVSEFQQGQSFIWETKSAGVSTIGRHTVRSKDGGSVVGLTIDQTGWLSPVVMFLLGERIRRYMQMEAQGLKQRCEAQHG